MFSDLCYYMKEAYWKKNILAFFLYVFDICLEKSVTIEGILCRFQAFICNRGNLMPAGKKLLLLS